MKALVCEMCGSPDLLKSDGMYICQSCGTRYTVEEAKKLMVEGKVQIDNSEFVKKYLENAQRALSKEDWEEVEKYYNMVEQNAPHNIEALFFSAFGKAMLSLTDSEYYKRRQKFGVLIKSMSVINDYFEVTTEQKEEVLRRISSAIEKMYSVEFVFDPQASGTQVGSRKETIITMNSVREAFLTELRQIQEAHSELSYIQELIDQNAKGRSAGCYVATCVYGSYDCPQVWTLRRFRDYTLAETWYGRAFIRTYYAISPTLVRWFGNTSWFKMLWKGKLDRMVSDLQQCGVESTPYEDRVW